MAEFGFVQSSGARLEALSSLIVAHALQEGLQRADMLEVGSYEGSSALAWSHALAKLPRKGTLLCIDPWASYHPPAQLAAGEHYRGMDRDLSSGRVLARFISNMKEAAEGVRVDWYVGTLDEWVRKLTELGADLPPRFDVIYVDGDHRYSSVKKDLELASWLLSPGGLLCGDDLERQVKLGSEEHAFCLRHAEEDYVDNFHPGVSLAVAEVIGPVGWTVSGAWAVRKRLTGWQTPLSVTDRL